MAAITEPDTYTVSIMAGTQIIKTELLINVCGYFIDQDPASILFVQPTQAAAASFSKERFAPTIEASPCLSALVDPPKTRDSENTITHKAYRGGSLDFVGANSPTDLASRPKRIILCDEIDKYPPSAGSEGDPLKLAEERASTFKAIGRAKFVRTCSPTVEGFSRIGREYSASDQRRCYVACPHCGFEQLLEWKQVRWDKTETGSHLPATAAICCDECGSIWSESDRIKALDALADHPSYGWRQTKGFTCCGLDQTPASWDGAGRSLCSVCGERSPYAGHAGFHLNKLYSKRHRLPEIVQEFLESKGDPELIRKFTNTALAELWKARDEQQLDSNKLMSRAEVYGPDDLPEGVILVTAFADTQVDRLEVQIVGWGLDEEAWPFQYTIIHAHPAGPQAWKELDALRASKFKVRGSDRILRIAALGIDMGGAYTAQVLAYCAARRGQRVFATQGRAGPKPLWVGRASHSSKTREPFYPIGVDTGKDTIYARLQHVEPREPGFKNPGFIHFPIGENFGLEYYEQLNGERKQVTLLRGQKKIAWLKIRERNEALDTLVGALAVRKSLPRYAEQQLQFSNKPDAQPAPATKIDTIGPAVLENATHTASERDEGGRIGTEEDYHTKFKPAARPQPFVPRRQGWMQKRTD
jgi:phage terminase large subunit GpA-like protein